MPRLKFELTPIDRNLGHWKGREEHDEWVREVFARHHPGVEPTPCDCGYFGDDWLTLCHGRSREDCHRHVEKRLENHYRQKHLQALREKRKFPGVPFPQTKRGKCHWCDGWITYPDGRLNTRRNWHPECKTQFFLHTDRDMQQGHLIGRDGIGCKSCGEIVGRWGRVCVYDEWAIARDMARDSALRRVFGEVDGPMTWISWSSSLEVDHVVALALVAHLSDAERRPYFGPDNLQLLCNPCHKVKTKADTAQIRALQRELAAGLTDDAPPANLGS